MTAERMWLDWDCALSIVGHDVEVKQTYAAILTSKRRPNLFVDIGANYGTHSLLFLSHNIETLSFEPNPSCHSYLRETCRLNALTPRLEECALGATPGTVELWYPETDTWLGSTDKDAQHDLQQKYLTTVRTVPQKTLDDFLASFVGRNVLVKIDTEGAEYQVLLGASRTLKEIRPCVIFESLGSDDRTKLYGLFVSHSYSVAHLPLFPDEDPHLLGVEQFCESRSSNFVAIPS
jgi:FkbM family methyltransferase